MGLVRLRAATPGAQRWIAALAAAARAEGMRHVDRLAAALAAEPDLARRPDHAFFVALDAGAAIGVGGLTPDPWAAPDTGRVRRLYVLPARRGEGYGAALLDAVEAEARTRCLARLRVRLGDPASAGFFERFGFAPVDEPEATHAQSLRPRAPLSAGVAHVT